MYSTVTKYLKTTNTNENVVFNASELEYDERYLKAVFITNETNTDAKINCSIRDEDNNDYFLFPKNLIVKAGDSVSAIQKTLMFNDNEKVIFKSSITGIECSLIIDYLAY